MAEYQRMENCLAPFITQEREMSQKKKEFESELEGSHKEEGVCQKIQFNPRKYYVKTTKTADLPIFQVFFKRSREKMRRVDWCLFWLNDLPGFIALLWVVCILIIVFVKE